MTPRPCGSWPSPITSELLTRETIRLGQLGIDGDAVLWTEARPADAGRQVLVRCGADGSRSDVTTAAHSVRSRVHEYGGVAWVADGGDTWFSDFGSARIHHVPAGGGPPVPVTPEGDLRYADLQVDRGRGRLITVLEDHTAAGEARNVIAALPLTGGPPQTLCNGHDFTSDARLSPDGRCLAWLTWDHPQMPWTSTSLWVAELDGDGRPGEAELITGGPREAVLQPRWNADGSLRLLTDREGDRWNLWEWSDRSGLRRLTDVRDAELGSPPWVLGLSDHVAAGDRVAVIAHRGPEASLWLVDRASGETTTVELPFTELSGIQARAGGTLALLAASPRDAVTVLEVDPLTGDHSVLRRAATYGLAPGHLSAPRLISFSSGSGRVAHAVHYPPTSADSSVPEGELPPLRVLSHGGPTAGASTSFSADTQYFTSRGFAVVDVDYGGSTGYGRRYREALDGNWGVVDVEDCIAAVRYLCEAGLADPRRVVIQGASAGGYTTLQSLVTSDVYAAGCSLFGVGDLRALAADTHKFESRYLDGLVGPLPATEAVWAERSPVLHADRLRSPVVLFQGLDDRVVPPAQSERFFEAARDNGLPCAYVAFEGEQHGFRDPANIRRCLDGELWFYSRVLGFTPDGDIEPLPMENAPG